MRHGAFGDGVGGVFAAAALAPVFEADERHAGVLPAAAETEAVDGENGADVGLFLLKEIGGDRLAHRRGAGVGGAGRQGVLHHHRTLILIGQETGRQTQIHHGGGDQQQAVQQQIARRPVDHPADLVGVLLLQPVITAVEFTQQPFVGLFFMRRFQQCGAQRRRQGQRQHD